MSKTASLSRLPSLVFYIIERFTFDPETKTGQQNANRVSRIFIGLWTHTGFWLVLRTHTGFWLVLWTHTGSWLVLRTHTGFWLVLWTHTGIWLVLRTRTGFWLVLWTHTGFWNTLVWRCVFIFILNCRANKILYTAKISSFDQTRNEHSQFVSPLLLDKRTVWLKSTKLLLFCLSRQKVKKRLRLFHACSHTVELNIRIAVFFLFYRSDICSRLVPHTHFAVLWETRVCVKFIVKDAITQ